MAETSFPYLGGGTVADASYEKLMTPITGGMFTSNPLLGPVMYADGTGRQVKFYANRSALIFGYRWETDNSGLTKPVEANTSGKTRIDLAVLRLDRSTRTIRAQIKPGTPADTPVPPGLTQQLVTTNPDGVWEIAAGMIKVTPTTTTQANAGLPGIQSNDLTPLDYYGGTQPLVTASNRMPPVIAGALCTQYDTGRLYRGTATEWVLLGEQGLFTSGAASSGWTAAIVALQRRNGLTWFQFSATRAGALLNAGTNSVVFTLADTWKPPGDVPLMGAMGASPLRFYVDASTGKITLTDSAAQIATGAQIFIHPATWPSN